MTHLRLVLASLAIAGCTVSTTERRGLPPLETVPHVDLARYMGTWYEIAAFPQKFQRGCTDTSATYALRDDGLVDVVNRCRKGSSDDVARGRARVVDRTTNAKLEVSFFRPFWGDYWIIQLGDDYEYAVVGHPGRDYLWILSRSRELPPDRYAGILEELKRQGYDVSRLVPTEHVR